MDINSQLRAFGGAQVLVALKSAGQAPVSETRKAAAGLAKNFVKSEADPSAQLAAAMPEMAGDAPAGSRFGNARVRRGQRAPSKPFHVYPHLGLMLGWTDRKGADKLASSNKVKDVAGLASGTVSLIKPVAVRAAIPPAQISWGLQRLRVPEVWAQGIDGRGVLVGHLDTGVDASHPALQGAVAKFVEIDATGHPIPNARPRDSGEHGTHTAGTILGRKVPGRGNFGVAPGAKLASGMVIEGGEVITRILAGLDWLVGLKVPILSMSLGLRGYNPAFAAIIDAVRAHGILPVIAVGNEGAGTSRSPGNYETVLSTGAFNISNMVAAFSSSQRFNRARDPLAPDLVGPGVRILSCTPNNTYQEMDGTSMATPHIAGLAALLKQAKPGATDQDLERALLRSCTLPGSMSVERANRGVPDAMRALQLLGGPILLGDAAGGSPRGKRPGARRAGAKARTKGRAAPKAARPKRKPATKRRKAK